MNTSRCLLLSSLTTAVLSLPPAVSAADGASRITLVTVYPGTAVVETER